MGKMRIVMIAICLMPVFAKANNGTINFTGRIVPSTCSINFGKADLTVPLGDVSAADLATPGVRAGKKEFSIELTGCSGAGTKVAAKFDSPDANLVSGRLKLDASSAASGVEIAIYDATDAHNKMGDQPPASASQTLSSGTAVLKYSAWYVATGDALVPGTANATATYTLVYE